MRIALVILLCMSAGTVSAQTTERCHALHRAGDLIACYDGKFIPAGIKRSKPRKAAVPYEVSQVDRQPTAAITDPTDRRAPVVDVLAIENSKLVAKMKAICRGC